MHAVVAEAIDGSGKRRGNRWDEDGEAAVLERMSDRRFSAGNQAGSSMVNGRTKGTTDCMPLSSTTSAR
jgi:hypothetical protein